MGFYSPDEVIREVDREIAMRRSTYGPLVKRGRMPQTEMDRRIAIMQQVKDAYVRQRNRQGAPAQAQLEIPEDAEYPANLAAEIVDTAREDAGV